MRYAFISHANDDKKRVAPLLDYLLRENIPIWIDRPDDVGLSAKTDLVAGIEAGADWDWAIRQACDKASCIIFFLSACSNELSRSDQLFREFEYAVRQNKLVLVKIDNIPPLDLQGAYRIRQAVDLSNLREDKYGRLYRAMNPALDLLVSTARKFIHSNETFHEDIAALKKGMDGLTELAGLVGNDLSRSETEAGATLMQFHRRLTGEHLYHRIEPANFTMFDVFNNIGSMILLRQDAALTIRLLLNISDPSQEQIDEYCYKIYETLSGLQRLIGMFHGITREIRDERYLRLPISMFKMMAETNFAIHSFILRLGYDERTGHNHPATLFSDPASRQQVEDFCDHLERTVEFLCTINVSDPKETFWR